MKSLSSMPVKDDNFPCGLYNSTGLHESDIRVSAISIIQAATLVASSLCSFSSDSVGTPVLVCQLYRVFTQTHPFLRTHNE